MLTPYPPGEGQPSDPNPPGSLGAEVGEGGYQERVHSVHRCRVHAALDEGANSGP